MTDYTKKLAAWLHDPAEKQLVLMRDPQGHEGGTVLGLANRLRLKTEWKEIKRGRNKGKQKEHLVWDKRADWLAAAADRPNWPRDEDAESYPQFESVKFSKEPELIHPLSGERIKPASLNLEIGVEQIKSVSQNQFEGLIQEDDDIALRDREVHLVESDLAVRVAHRDVAQEDHGAIGCGQTGTPDHEPLPQAGRR